jgi:S-adenosyl-L-methionine hydrolase (adenosine-forming)
VSESAALPVTFLSDYGYEDDFVGVCHGVIARIAPEARVIDITHGIPRHNVRAAALVLRNALPYMPPGVHLAVVDPEVGAERRAVAIRCAGEGGGVGSLPGVGSLAGGDRLLVGPDNGVLSLAAERLGGAVEAMDIGRSPWRLEPVAATFHGRDIFAPVAARLAAGAPLAEAGEPCDTDSLARIELSRPDVQDGALVAHALAVDRFGNVILDATHADLDGSDIKLGRPVELAAGSRRFTAWYAVTFADVRAGELLVYEDAYRMLAVAVNRGDAAQLLGLGPGGEMRIAPA